MNPSKIKPGDTVLWDNPDGDAPKTIKVQDVAVRGDIVLLRGHDGSVTEAIAHELGPPKNASQIAREHREALRLLRDIAWAASLGSEYRGARVSALLDAVDNAEAWLEVIDEL
ncbi:MAG: hypothetical protein EBR52_06855 [Microbacteriaceae bacterium]|nr:hypothetical protein [Microbacteriaceae bacterium]